MAKKPPRKPGNRHLGKAGKVIPMRGKDNVDAEAIAASNKVVGVDAPVTKFPTFVDMRAKVHEGLIASNYIVYQWAQDQKVRMEKLQTAMEVIEDVTFTREELNKLTVMQRIKLWKTFEQAGIIRIELLQAINNKARDISLTERFLEGYEREKNMAEGSPTTELPYSPEFRAKVRTEYLNRVLGITHEPEQPEK